MTALKESLGDDLYNQALQACESLSPMGVPVKEMSREDLAVCVALLIKEIQTRRPDHAAELVARAQRH